MAERVREILLPHPGMREQKMFGGLAFMVSGYMCCGVVGDELMVRLGQDGAERAIERPHVRPMDFTGRPMTTMVFVSSPGLRGGALKRWVDQATNFVKTLPEKSGTA